MESFKSEPKLVTLLSWPACFKWKLIHLMRMVSGGNFCKSVSSSPSRARRMISGQCCKSIYFTRHWRIICQSTARIKWCFFSMKAEVVIPGSFIPRPLAAFRARFKFSFT
jgi:hypothetical protein